MFKEALGVRIQPLYKVPGSYYNKEWSGMDELNEDEVGEDNPIGDNYKDLILQPYRRYKYYNSSDERIVKKALNIVKKKEKFPLGDLVILPNGFLGKVIGFKGENKRIVLTEDGNKSFILDITKLKEQCK